MGLLLLALAWSTAAGAVAAAADRPNILWLTAEDMSPHLGSYGDPAARTPHLDRLAAEGIRFERVFATAPVCSPARSCLITGMYATSLGTQRLRSQFPIPEWVEPFPARLRRAGYYCTNNVKTDYNVRDEAAMIRAAWDDSSPTASWRGARAGQPFFSVVNFMTTHQSRTGVWPAQQFEKEIASRLAPADRYNPNEIVLPPYYPESPLARQAWARYRECITVLDQEIGAVLAELAADGHADNTIVFFFSDHGMGMPRGKRCLYDSGMQVPLLVRFPPRWAHWAPGPAGSASDQLISFVDFAPTVLKLAVLSLPAHLQGQAFLGEDAPATRPYAFGARDRVDEAFDVARSVRDPRWLYIRNYMPHLPWLQPEAFSDGSPFRHQLARQPPFAARRDIEELYDTQRDPHQLHNLAADFGHHGTLVRLRSALRAWQMETRDAGFITEPQMRERMQPVGTPWQVARTDDLYPLSRLLRAAEAVGRADAASSARDWLADQDDAVRYWGSVGLRAQRELSSADRGLLRPALLDPSAVVRIEAAAALAWHGEPETALPVLIAALDSPSHEVVLHAARALELLGPLARPAHARMRELLPSMQRAEAKGDDLAMFIRFSLAAALADTP